MCHDGNYQGGPSLVDRRGGASEEQRLIDEFLAKKGDKVTKCPVAHHENDRRYYEERKGWRRRNRKEHPFEVEFLQAGKVMVVTVKAKNEQAAMDYVQDSFPTDGRDTFKVKMVEID